MFYNKFVQLCVGIGKTPSVVAKELGINKSTVSCWKSRKSLPSDASLVKISNYFGVGVDLLLSDEQKEKPTDGERTITDDDIKFALFGGDGEITDAMYQEVRNFADYIKQREADKKKE